MWITAPRLSKPLWASAAPKARHLSKTPVGRLGGGCIVAVPKLSMGVVSGVTVHSPLYDDTEILSTARRNARDAADRFRFLLALNSPTSVAPLLAMISAP